MQKKTLVFSTQCLLIAILIIFYSSAHAHHSFSATFKSDEIITIHGVVTAFSFRNPHITISMDVTNNDGSVTAWVGEGSSATTWRRGGWEPNALKQGDMISITGNSTKDGSPMVSIDSLDLLGSDGLSVIETLNEDTPPSGLIVQTTQAAGSNTDIFTIPLTLPSGEPNFTGTTMQRGGMIEGIVGAPHDHDQEMPYNELGKTAFESDEWSIANDPQIFCDPPGLVRQAAYTPYGFKIAQYAGHITIEYEEYGTRRSIFFDDELPKPGLRSNMGDSVARYEGDSLVIETVNLRANLSGHRGRPLSDEARVTEVYTRVDNPKFGSIVETKTTVVDPKFLTEPWTIKRYKLYAQDYSYIENECKQPLRDRPANVFQYSDFDQQYVK